MNNLNNLINHGNAKLALEKINFFNLGKQNKWQNILDQKLISKIESAFKI